MNKFNRNDNAIYEAYTKEVKRYSLLTEEEEIKCTNNIRNINSSIMCSKVINNICIKSLDLNKLFLSLDANNYNIVINKLLNYYRDKNNFEDKKIYKCLSYYRKESDAKNRYLEIDELKEIINLDYNVKRLDSNNLIEEVDKFLLYKESYDKLFLSNLRLVLFFANKYCRNNEMIMDLISEGNIGLMRAISDYDPTLNIKFSTYASIWIKQKVGKYFVENDSSVRLPYNMKVKFMKYDKLLGNQKKTMTRNDIKKFLNISESEMREYEKYKYETVSLNQEINDDGDTYESFLKDDSCLEDDSMNEFLKDDIKCLFEKLNDQEKKVITLRYGLDTYCKGGLTLKEIGVIMNLTGERIRMIEFRALNKMRLMANKKEKCKSLINYLRS